MKTNILKIILTFFLIILFSNLSLAQDNIENNFEKNNTILSETSNFPINLTIFELTGTITDRENNTKGNFSYYLIGFEFYLEDNTTNFMPFSEVMIIINSSGVFNETYYYANDKLLAKKDNSGNKTYYHSDHLGSTTLVTNQSGSIVEEEFYLPHGDVYSGSESSRYLYTGKELDKAIDLYYYGARYYQASIMRMFIQPDSIISDIYNPQNLNKYSYVLNNPYKYTDDSGNIPVDVVVDVGFIGYDIYTIIQDPSNSANYVALGLGAGFKVAKGIDKAGDVADVAKSEKIAQETAEKLGTAANRFEGITKHREAATTIKESGIKDLFTEISIKERGKHPRSA